MELKKHQLLLRAAEYKTVNKLVCCSDKFIITDDGYMHCPCCKRVENLNEPIKIQYKLTKTSYWLAFVVSLNSLVLIHHLYNYLSK